MMKHIKLYESFDKDKDERNYSIKSAKKPKPLREDDESNKENKRVEKDLNGLFDKLVPNNGKADTVEGEMVRAINRIWYRYTNDGDYYFRGYGKETAQPSVTWLKTKCPIKKEIAQALNSARENALPADRIGRVSPSEQFTEKDGYLNGLRAAAKLIVDYVKGKNGKYTPNEDHDSR